MNETDRLAGFVVDTDYEDFDQEALDAAKTTIRDFIGAAMYGSRHPIGERIHDYVTRMLPGTDATVIGHDSASLEGAAVANGVAGHAIDYDDTFESIPIHPTGAAFSAALAAAESSSTPPRNLLTGYIIGVETTYRVGQAMFPGHYYNGFHATGTVGSFGAAAAAASVLGLDVAQTRRAFGVCASGSSSLLKNFGTMTKPYHAGHAAGMGIRAACLAQAGFTADESILEGDSGYGSVMAFGDYDPAEITANLGDGWAVREIGVKAYPVILIVQAPMEALRRVIERENLQADAIESITATLPDKAADVLADVAPVDADQAKFTIEFPLAAIVREGNLTLEQVTDEYVRDQATRKEMEKVHRVFDSAALGDGFDRYGGRVTVRTTEGAEFTASEPITPGMPDNPLSADRLRKKFLDCAGPVLGRDQSQTLWETLGRFEEIDLEALSDRIAGPLPES